MSYKVLIRRNSDRQERWQTMSNLDWDDHSVFWWTEGNFGCDCNRHMQFQRAGDEPIETDHACSESAYSVIKAVLPDGTEIAIDEDEQK
jgi:hypothetical protein